MDHTIVHFEIPADDVEKLRRFYSRLFGWRIEKTPGPMDYWLIETVPTDAQGRPLRPGVNGGMMKKQHPQHRFTHYIQVESVDDYCRKVEELGGKVLTQKMDVPNMGWWALVMDPEGSHLALWEEMKK